MTEIIKNYIKSNYEKNYSPSNIKRRLKQNGVPCKNENKRWSQVDLDVESEKEKLSHQK